MDSRNDDDEDDDEGRTREACPRMAVLQVDLETWDNNPTSDMRQRHRIA